MKAGNGAYKLFNDLLNGNPSLVDHFSDDNTDTAVKLYSSELLQHLQLYNTDNQNDRDGGNLFDDNLFASESKALGHEVDGRHVIGMLMGELRPTMVEAVRRCAERLKTGLLTNNFVTTAEGVLVTR